MIKLIKMILEYAFSSDLFLWCYIRIRNKTPRIILFHGISNRDYEMENFQVIAEKTFEGYLKYLKKHYILATLEQVIAERQGGPRLPRNAITITFDDGYENNYLFAVPLLKKYGLSATFFISPKYVEAAQKNEKVVMWWDIIDYVLDENHRELFMSMFNKCGLSIAVNNDLKTLKEEMRRALIDAEIDIFEKLDREMRERLAKEIGEKILPGVMNWEQLKKIKIVGMSVGAHTMSHPTVSKLSGDRLKFELLEPKILLEQRLGGKIDTFAFPYGGKEHYTKEAIALLKSTGYKCALLVLSRNTEIERDPFCINRTSIAKEDSFRLFKIKAAGVYDDILNIYFWMKHICMKKS